MPKSIFVFWIKRMDSISVRVMRIDCLLPKFEFSRCRISDPKSDEYAACWTLDLWRSNILKDVFKATQRFGTSNSFHYVKYAWR